MFQSESQYKKKLAKELADMKLVVLQTRSMLLHREHDIRIRVSSLRSVILSYLPLEDIHQESVDFFFSNPTVQEVIVEEVYLLLAKESIVNPTEGDISEIALDLCFSGYLQAHAYWGKKLPSG